MRRQSQREVEAAAQRRLELLRRELDQAGLSRLDEPPDHEDAWPPPPGLTPGTGEEAEEPELPAPVRVTAPGRHARDARKLGVTETGVASRLSAAVADRLPETFRGRVGLQHGPTLLVMALVAAAVLVGAVVLARSGAQSRPLPPQRAATPAVVSRSAAPPGASGSPSDKPPAGNVTVDVAGKVRRPGVITLPTGSRVIDALKHAGGARPRADLAGLNLARVLVDGEQIVVGKPPVAGGIGASVASGAPAPTGALVGLNTASEEQLETLPGVGPVTAQKILQWRTDHGAFSSVDELMEIDGIGEKTFAEIAPLVTL